MRALCVPMSCECQLRGLAQLLSSINALSPLCLLSDRSMKRKNGPFLIHPSDNLWTTSYWNEASIPGGTSRFFRLGYCLLLSYQLGVSWVKRLRTC